MKKALEQMWADPSESVQVRDLLKAGRDSSDLSDYDFDAGLQQHMHLVKIGAPPPAWAGEMARQGVLSASSGAVPWWGWIAASLLGVTSGALVWSDGLPSRNRDEVSSEFRIVENRRSTPAKIVAPVVSAPAVAASPERKAAPGRVVVPKAIRAARSLRSVVDAREGRRSVEAAQGANSRPSISDMYPEFDDGSSVATTRAPQGATGPGAAAASGVTKPTPSKPAAKRATQTQASDRPVAVTAPAPDRAALKRLAEARERNAREALLEREMRMLKVAQASLDTNPSRSLRLAEQGEREFSHSLFKQERQYVLIAALARLGRQGEARERATAYLKRYPSGPFSERVRKALETD